MIHIENISFQYQAGKTVVDNINTTLQSGHVYGLLGLSGEGKTTLLKLIAGLLFPTQGDIRLNNIYTTNRSATLLEQLYMLPDQPISPNLKIAEYVQIYSPFYRNFSKELFNNAIQDFHLSSTDKIKSLSFGQQKKFHLAFALSTNTKYLFLDEPTNGLDIPSKKIVCKLLAHTINEDKIILVSTHLINDIENLIDHLLIMKSGKLVFDMSVYDILHRYAFTQSATLPMQPIYHEQTLSTYRSILQNGDNIETNIDIELLFNAVQQAKI